MQSTGVGYPQPIMGLALHGFLPFSRQQLSLYNEEFSQNLKRQTQFAAGLHRLAPPPMPPCQPPRIVPLPGTLPILPSAIRSEKTRIIEEENNNNAELKQAAKNGHLKFGIDSILSPSKDNPQAPEEPKSPHTPGNSPLLPPPFALGFNPTAPVLSPSSLAALHMPYGFGRSPIDLQNLPCMMAPNRRPDSPSMTLNPKRKRSWSRAVFSNLQRKGLEKRFEVQKYVTKPDRRQLAAMLGLTDAQVKVWFQNRRMKWRREEEAKRKADGVVNTDLSQNKEDDSDIESENDLVVDEENSDEQNSSYVPLDSSSLE